MRLRPALAGLALVVSRAAAAPASVQLEVHQTIRLDYPGVSAAFAVDTDIVEATAIGDRVELTGRRAGQTPVTVVMAESVETLIVLVEQTTHVSRYETSASRRTGEWEGRYESETQRFSTSLTVPFGEGERRALLHLYAIQQPDAGGGGTSVALPSASLVLDSPGRTVVILDELVEASPLTLDGNLLRGVHLHQGPLTVHAGTSFATPWEDFLLPSSGDRALGASYRIGDGALRLVPALLWLPDTLTAVPGVVSLRLEGGAPGDALQVTGELGWSDVPGVSVDINYLRPRRQGWLQGATRPVRFAALDVSRPAGTYLDGAWSERLGARTTADVSLSASSLEGIAGRPEAASARFELRNQLTRRWALTTGVDGSEYHDRRLALDTLRRRSISLGTAYDAPGLGFASTYRYQQISGTSIAGHGGRVTLHAAREGFRANLFLDAQQQAPTIELVLRDRPDLARVFAELGFVATTPEEVVRLLRDNAALFAQRGVIVGPLDLVPLRLHAGLEIAWRNPGPSRAGVGLRLTCDDAQGVTTGRRTCLSTVFASRRIFRDVELTGGYTHWSTWRDGSPAEDHGSFELAVRTSFSAPRLHGGGRAISGRVVRDDRAAGVLDRGLPPLADVEVVLDGRRRTRTDGDGRFVFDAPGRAEHRVEAVLPQQAGAYFTAPSAVTVPSGGEARFAITFAAPRLSGTVHSDAGLPIAGVVVGLEGPTEARATTDSSGVYRFAGPAGEARVRLVADSVPPGYELGDLAPQVRLLSPGVPAIADFTLRAQRVVEGMVQGAGSAALTVIALEAGRSVSPDEAGHFLFRGLSAGPLTLIVRGALGETRRVVEVPAPPGSVSGLKLVAPGSRASVER